MIKWIGQHIVDFIARFRSDVYLEDIADGTVVDNKFLGLDSNNKIVKEAASTTVTDLHTAGVDGANNNLLTDKGDGTIQSEGSLTFDGSTLDGDGGSQIKSFEEIGDSDTELFGKLMTLSSAGGSNVPYIELVSSHVDSNAPQITFQKTATGADDDDLGEIKFRGDDEGNGAHDYAIILAEIADATPGEEAGRLSFKVAEFDGTVTTGLTINGDTNANGEVDVTIGAGTGSSTSVAGKLSSYGFDIVNAADAGRSAVDIFNYDVDQIALDIDASNTTGNIIDVSAASLTTGNALFIDCNSLTTGSCISIDVDDAVADNGANFSLIDLQYDKSANNTSGTKFINGINIEMDDDATGNTANTFLRGVSIDIDAANPDGVEGLTGVDVDLTGGDAAFMTAFHSRVEDGGIDFQAVSSADSQDKFYIQTGTHGATTLTTVDSDATIAHFEIAADGNIILDAAGDIALEAGGGDVTGDAQNYTLTSSTTNKPHFKLANTTSDATGPILTFDNSDTGSADHVLGSIAFNGTDSNDNPEEFALIKGQVSAASDGAEGGRLSLQVASHNGTLTTGLAIEDGDASGEVDVTIANGAASITTVAGDLTVTSKASIPTRKFAIPADGAGNADGDVVYIGTGSTVIGKIYYYKSDGTWGLTNSDDPGTATGWLAVALGTDPDVDGMLVRGTVDLATDIVGTEALGSIIYLDKATTGTATTAAPTATGDIVRVIGYALTTGNANKIWFSPDNTWVEHV